MKLSILIATLGARHKKLKELLAVLMPQVDAYNGEIEVVAYWNNGELPIGEIRQALLEDAKGEYICFVDDDDMVPEYYCKEIMDNLSEDYVGFKVVLTSEGNKKPPVYHSLRYATWDQDEMGYYRNVTHLNPVRRSLAMQVAFSGGMGEDGAWAALMKPLVKTERFIDRDMYFYNHYLGETSFGGRRFDLWPQIREPVDSKNFRYHKNSKLRYKGKR